jgi:protein-tyrosine phosphatase
MFSFLSKKVPLRDQLNGLPDIHNHLLPGIDDGADSVKSSLALIEAYLKLGITNFIATPHIMNDYYPNTPSSINSAHNNLNSSLKLQYGEKIQVRVAAEYMMDQNFLELVAKEKLLCLHKNFVLVEMSYFQAPINLNEILFKLQTQQYKPVLAHPERYAFFHSKSLQKYEDLKSRGCLFQLNLLSVLGHYGKHIQDAAFKLLDNNMIDFIGTDTHQPRHLEKILNAKISQKKMDQLRPIFEKTKNTFMPVFI